MFIAVINAPFYFVTLDKNIRWYQYEGLSTIGANLFENGYFGYEPLEYLLKNDGSLPEDTAKFKIFLSKFKHSRFVVEFIAAFLAALAYAAIAYHASEKGWKRDTIPIVTFISCLTLNLFSYKKLTDTLEAFKNTVLTGWMSYLHGTENNRALFQQYKQAIATLEKTQMRVSVLSANEIRQSPCNNINTAFLDWIEGTIPQNNIPSILAAVGSWIKKSLVVTLSLLICYATLVSYCAAAEVGFAGLIKKEKGDFGAFFFAFLCLSGLMVANCFASNSFFDFFLHPLLCLANFSRLPVSGLTRVAAATIGILQTLIAAVIAGGSSGTAMGLYEENAGKAYFAKFLLPHMTNATNITSTPFHDAIEIISPLDVKWTTIAFNFQIFLIVLSMLINSYFNRDQQSPESKYQEKKMVIEWQKEISDNINHLKQNSYQSNSTAALLTSLGFSARQSSSEADQLIPGTRYQTEMTL
ncbi:MAG: hypothetical protein A3E84_05435 [Gammaproteobacteria bacterium RIFCSPHIGHO2_12_FULL_42_13]|nr:MAG: hypothetical protein A3E84_05435 [Gammaproteobacteria bacterium RIFCSPHIGHO2_12_FULL_42_13]